MKIEYHKKVDRSLLKWGFTVPLKLLDGFLFGKNIQKGSSRPITLILGRKRFEAKIMRHNRKDGKEVYQIRWDNNRDLLYKLRQTFIQSYVIIKSQKELFDNQKNEETFRTKMQSGQQEVIKIIPIKAEEIKIKEFIVIKNDWNELFKRLVKENVFGWIFDKKEKEYLIQKSTNWISVDKFDEHKNAVNVIYYLAKTKTDEKLLYVGEAKNLGDRVKPGKDHQGMPGDWDRFKYDIIRPEFSNILVRIEDHTIRTIASILKNNQKYSSLEIGDYRLVNKSWGKL